MNVTFLPRFLPPSGSSVLIFKILTTKAVINWGLEYQKAFSFSPFKGQPSSTFIRVTADNTTWTEYNKENKMVVSTPMKFLKQVYILGMLLTLRFMKSAKYSYMKRQMG